MDIQDKIMDQKQIKESNINTFVSSFITDALVFAAALLTVIITFIIIYILSRQSKLKTLVANIALQCAKAVEAAVLHSNTNNSQQDCEIWISKVPHAFKFDFSDAYGPCKV